MNERRKPEDMRSIRLISGLLQQIAEVTAGSGICGYKHKYGSRRKSRINEQSATENKVIKISWE
jgi:hypothetical protein